VCERERVRGGASERGVVLLIFCVCPDHACLSLGQEACSVHKQVLQQGVMYAHRAVLGALGDPLHSCREACGIWHWWERGLERKDRRYCSGAQLREHQQHSEAAVDESREPQPRPAATCYGHVDVAARLASALRSPRASTRLVSCPISAAPKQLLWSMEKVRPQHAQPSSAAVCSG